MKNKKGFLLGEETLKIVLAVIAIGFLIGFLVLLYYSYTSNKDLDLAEASLEHLISEIDSGATSVEIYNPKGWGVVAWPNEGIDFSGEIISIFGVEEGYVPVSCSGAGWEKCICICDTIGLSGLGYKNFADSCGEKGACLESTEETSVERGFIEIKDPPLILTIDYLDEIEITKAQT